MTFANLIADGATGLASRLTGRLTLSATAALQSFLQVCFVDSFNMFHVNHLSKNFGYYSTIPFKFKEISRFFEEKIFRRRLNPADVPKNVNNYSDRHNVAQINVQVTHKETNFTTARHNPKIHHNPRDNAN